MSHEGTQKGAQTRNLPPFILRFVLKIWKNVLKCYLVFCCCFVFLEGPLGIEPRTSYILGECSTIDSHSLSHCSLSSDPAVWVFLPHMSTVGNICQAYQDNLRKIFVLLSETRSYSVAQTGL